MVELVTLVAVSIIAIVAFGLLMKWLEGARCRSQARLDGKTVIITGSNTGIGKETAKDLAKRGARVIMACRNEEKAKAAQLEVIESSGNPNVVVKKLDLSSLKSIRAFAEEINREEKRLDILLNNAGVMICPDWKTEDGFEMQLGTNHLGHFLLTHLLLDLLRASTPSRVVNVASKAHDWGQIYLDDPMLSRQGYDGIKAYCQSKLANVLFTRELAKRLAGSGVTTYCLCPGGVATDLQRHGGTKIGTRIFLTLARPFFKTSEQGAQTNIHCCVDEQAGKETGLYYRDCKPQAPAKQAQDDETARKLWDLSMELVGLDK